MSFANVRAPAGHRLCRFLRCKEMYYTVPDAVARAREDPAAAFENKVFWCTKTWRAEGPEGAACDAEACHPDRACYEE